MQRCPSGTAVQRHHFSYHYYADDVLICAEIPDDPGKAISCLMRCRSDTKSGMSETLLKLRLTFHSRRFLSTAVLHSQSFGFAALGSPVIQNLLQSPFGLNQTHIRSIFFSFRKYKEATSREEDFLINAICTSCLDQGNSFLVAPPDCSPCIATPPAQFCS